MKLAINRCPVHGNFWAVSIDDDSGGGRRMTPGKCCGRWEVVKEWRLSAREWSEFAAEAENAADIAMELGE